MENVTNLPEEGANVTNENVTETASVNTETVTTANDAVESLENANTAMATAETNVAEMPNPEVAIEATPAEIQQTEDAIEAPAEIVDAAPEAIETVASEAEAKPKSVEAKETPAKAETPDAPVDHETAALDAAHSELAGGEHEHEDEVQEPVEDYHTYKKEQLVEAIEKTVNESDVIAVRNKVFAMREAFSQMQSAERNTALNSFIEEGRNHGGPVGLQRRARATAATITIGAHSGAYETKLQADTQYALSYSQVAGAGKVWGIFIPHAQIAENPGDTPINAVHGAQVKFQARVPDDAGTTTIATSKILLAIG